MNSMDTDLKEIIEKHKQEKFGQEANKGEDKGRRGKANNAPEQSNTGSASDIRLPKNNIPELPPTAHHASGTRH